MIERYIGGLREIETEKKGRKGKKRGRKENKGGRNEGKQGEREGGKERGRKERRKEENGMRFLRPSVCFCEQQERRKRPLQMQGLINRARGSECGGTPPFLWVELPKNWGQRIRTKPLASQHQANWSLAFIS